MLMLITLIQILVFCTGSILLIYAGKQDEETRNPFLLIPALMAIGLSAGLVTFLIVSLASFAIFFLPKKVNKVIGKADLLLFASILTINILCQNILLTLFLYLTLGNTIIIMLLDKNLKKEVPLIHYYSIAYAITIIMFIGLIIGTLIGVVLL